MKKYHLLDHKWQKIGFAIFVFGIALFLIFLLNSVFTFQPTQIEGLVENYKLRLFNSMLVPSALLSFFLAIAFALMALSQEKQEDERIVETRHQVLPRIVILYIIVLAIRFIAFSSAWRPDSSLHIKQDCRYCGSPVDSAYVYTINSGTLPVPVRTS